MTMERKTTPPTTCKAAIGQSIYSRFTLTPSHLVFTTKPIA